MKRPTRSMLGLVEAPPVRSELLGSSVVEVNTNEARRLFLNKAELLMSRRFLGRRVQMYRYGGKLFVWIAGYTTLSGEDDYPVPPESGHSALAPSPAQIA